MVVHSLVTKQPIEMPEAIHAFQTPLIYLAANFGNKRCSSLHLFQVFIAIDLETWIQNQALKFWRTGDPELHRVLMKEF